MNDEILKEFDDYHARCIGSDAEYTDAEMSNILSNCLKSNYEWDRNFLLEKLTLAHKQGREEMGREVVVDLFEIRASFVKPLQARQMEKVENVFQYNFFSAVLANLIGKYKISHEDIESEIRKRSQEESLSTLKLSLEANKQK